jgi:hypothetical protein
MRWINFAAYFSLAVAGAWGQLGSGSITGVVRDGTQGAVPGARIRATNTASGVATTVVTNEDGAYRIHGMVAGSYDIEAAASGFDTVVRKDVPLATGQTAAVDLALQVGQQNLTVNVEASAAGPETQTSSVAQVVGHLYIDSLPLPNRSANSLVSLSPGVVMLDSGQGAENYPVFAVAGGRNRNQSFTLDGGSIGNAVGLTRSLQTVSLPLDALEEFRIISNSYAAEYGHSTGGIVSLATRSGTNQFHGSLFEYVRNDALDARNFFAKTKPPLRLNQFGGALGGPIRRDKTHFFASWEQTRQTSSDAVISTVPSALQRAGDFAGGALIYDPLSPANGVKQPFADNRIPAERLDRVAQTALAYWPLPNRGSGTGANNFGGNTNFHLNRNIVVGKLDHTFTENDRASARYYINDASTSNGGSYGIAVSDPLATSTDVRIQSFLATHLHTFSPTLINTFQLSLMQRKFLQTRGGAGDNLAGTLGFGGVSGAAFPTFNVTGYALLGSQGVANSSIARIQSPICDWQVQDSIAKVAGRHALKAGIEYRRGSNRESNDLSSSGNLVFNRLITGQAGAATTGDAFASYLLGLANSASLSRTDVIHSRASYWAAYLQDDFRLTDRLTINAGLRWEAELPRWVEGNKLNGFDPIAINPVSGTPGAVTFAGLNGVPRTSFDANLANFAPRVGFAYNAGLVVLRGGAGLFYGPNVSNSITTSATLGFADNVSLVTSQADSSYVLQLSNGFPASRRPAVGDAGAGAVPLGARPTTAIQFFERHRPTPRSYQYNFNVQRGVPGGVVVEAGYIGNVSHHLTANDVTLNQLLPSQFGPGNTQAARPFPQYSNVISLNPAIGNSTYHAGYSKAERRFANGVSFLAHYTFSKFLDDVASGDEFGDPGSYLDQYNRRLDKGRSGTDVPHHLTLTAIFEVPRLKRSRLLDAVAGGWQASVYGNFQSGQTFTVYDSANTTNGFPAGTLRPDLIGNPELAGSRTLDRYFNTAAFAHPASYRFGSAPRSVLRGPHSENLDFGVAKTFRASERLRTELRGEFFNVFNIANFDMPGHTLGNADFGAINSARPARVVELALRLMF